MKHLPKKETNTPNRSVDIFDVQVVGDAEGRG